MYVGLIEYFSLAEKEHNIEKDINSLTNIWSIYHGIYPACTLKLLYNLQQYLCRPLNDKLED